MNKTIFALVTAVFLLGIAFASPGINPSEKEEFMSSAERLFMAGRYDESLSFFERLINKEPAAASAYVRIGDIYMLKNDSKRAAGYYSQALKVSPQLCSAAVKLGKAYEKQGNSEGAFNVYNSVISRYPSYSDAWLARGDLMLRRGAVERAISDFDASLKANPRNSAASLARGIAWLNKGALQRAVFDFNVVVMTYDGIAPASVPGDVLAWAYYYRGKAYDTLDKNDPMRGSNYGYAVKAQDSFKAFLACPAPLDSEKEVAFAKTYLYSPDIIRAGVKADVVKVTLIGKDKLLITMQVVNSTDRTVTAVSADKFDLYLDDDIIGRRNVTFTPENRKYIMPGSSGFLYLSLPDAGHDFTNWSVTIFETQIHTI